MPKTELKDTLKMVEELERLPPEHAMRIIPIALRECEDSLVQHVLAGSVRAKPLTWTRFVAVGNLEAGEMVAWGVYPSPTEPADYEEIARMKATLMKERVARCDVEQLAPLKETGVLTGAIALFGEDAAGKPVLLIARHPDLSRPKAVCILIAAIMMLEAQVGSAAN